MASNEWGPWIEHDGKGCPCVGMYVQLELSHEPDIMPDWAIIIKPRLIEALIPKNGAEWCGCDYCYVIRYRIRKPRALSMLQKIARDIGSLVDA